MDNDSIDDEDAFLSTLYKRSGERSGENVESTPIKSRRAGPCTPARALKCSNKGETIQVMYA